MGDFLTILLGVCVCNLLVALTKLIKYKSYDASLEDEVITKRIYKSCKRKWSSDKKGTLKARYRTFEAYVDSCVKKEFEWRRYL